MVTVTTPCFKRSAFTSGIPNDLLIQLDELLPRCMYFQWKKHVRTLHSSKPQTVGCKYDFSMLFFSVFHPLGIYTFYTSWFFDVQWCILMVKIIWTLDQWSNWTISSDLRIRIQLFQEIILVEILAGCCCCCCFTGWFQKCDAMVMSQDFFDLGIEGGTCWNFNDHSEVKNGIKIA